MSDHDALEAVAGLFRDSLPPSDHISTFRIDQLDRIGVPVVQANLILPNEPATIGYGYGLTTIEAEVGALGELCEEVHVGTWVKARLTSSHHSSNFVASGVKAMWSIR